MVRLLKTGLIEKPGPRTVRDPDACRQNLSAQRLYDINTYTVDTEFWFKQTRADNQPKSVVPDFATPMFKYSITYDQRCSEDPGTAPHVSADMQFYDVPKFTCVSDADLARVMPLAKPVPATDGAIVYSAPSKNRKTYIFLYYVFSGKCASMIDIHQGF